MAVGQDISTGSMSGPGNSLSNKVPTPLSGNSPSLEAMPQKIGVFLLPGASASIMQAANITSMFKLTSPVAELKNWSLVSVQPHLPSPINPQKSGQAMMTPR